MNKLNRTVLTVAAAAALWLIAHPGGAAQNQDRAEVALKAAMDKEIVDGDLKSAIEQYKKLSQNSNRAVAAKALLRMALVYRKQGDTQARQTLERLVQNYGDQQQVVAEARSELARMSDGKTAMGTRLLWDDPGNSVIYNISRDGRLAGIKTRPGSNVGVHDLQTGQTRLLTQRGTYDAVLVSPDGRWVAFNAGTPEGLELRVVRSDGSSPATLVRAGGDIRVRPTAWTPDSKQVLCAMRVPLNEAGQQGNARFDMVLVSVPSGEMRVVVRDAQFPPGAGAAVSPDGRWIAYSARGIGVRVVSIDGGLSNQVTSGPGESGTVGWSPDGKFLLYSSSLSNSYTLHAVAMEGGKPVGAPQEVRYPGAGWEIGLDGGGTLYYADFQSPTNAFVAGLDAGAGRFTSPPARVTKDFKGRNAAPVWSPDGTKLAWFFLAASEVRPKISAVIIRDVATGKERQMATQVPAVLWTSPTWLSDGKSILLAADNARAGGFDFGLQKVDVDTGNPLWRSARMEGQVTYTPSWSPDGSQIYRPDPLTNKESGIYVWDGGTGAKRVVFRDPVASYIRDITLSPDGSQIAYVAGPPKGSPDDSRLDQIKVLDVASGQTREVVRIRPAWLRRSMNWTPDGKHLLYATENWYGLAADEPTRLWIVPAAGGTPRQLGSDFKGRVFDLTVSPDGKQLGFSVTEYHRELWALENFLPAATKAAK